MSEDATTAERLDARRHTEVFIVSSVSDPRVFLGRQQAIAWAQAFSLDEDARCFVQRQHMRAEDPAGPTTGSADQPEPVLVGLMTEDGARVPMEPVP